jgi:hypothetical protein
LRRSPNIQATAQQEEHAKLEHELRATVAGLESKVDELEVSLQRQQRLASLQRKSLLNQDNGQDEKVSSQAAAAPAAPAAAATAAANPKPKVSSAEEEVYDRVRIQELEEQVASERALRLRAQVTYVVVVVVVVVATVVLVVAVVVGVCSCCGCCLVRHPHFLISCCWALVFRTAPCQPIGRKSYSDKSQAAQRRRRQHHHHSNKVKWGFTATSASTTASRISSSSNNNNGVVVFIVVSFSPSSSSSSSDDAIQCLLVIVLVVIVVIFFFPRAGN